MTSIGHIDGRTGEPPTSGGRRRRRRADAQRNVEKLIAAGRDAFATHGPDASLDDIAKKAGVGSATLYRHFPTRLALLEAVYRDGVEQLCTHGRELVETAHASEALVEWLRGFVVYVAQKRGLAGALTTDPGRNPDLFAECHAMINETGALLLERAKAAGAVREDVTLTDVLRLAGAIAYAGETSEEGAALSERLLSIAMDGLRPRRAPDGGGALREAEGR